MTFLSFWRNTIVTFSHCSGLMTILDEFKLYVQLILAYKSQYIVAPSIQKTGFEFYHKTLNMEHKKFSVHLSLHEMTHKTWCYHNFSYNIIIRSL